MESFEAGPIRPQISEVDRSLKLSINCMFQADFTQRLAEHQFFNDCHHFVLKNSIISGLDTVNSIFFPSLFRVHKINCPLIPITYIQNLHSDILIEHFMFWIINAYIFTCSQYQKILINTTDYHYPDLIAVGSTAENNSIVWWSLQRFTIIVSFLLKKFTEIDI